MKRNIGKKIKERQLSHGWRLRMRISKTLLVTAFSPSRLTMLAVTKSETRIKNKITTEMNTKG